MTPNHAARILHTTKALRASMLVVLQQVDELSKIADEMVTAGSSSPSVIDEPICRVERETLSVFWEDQVCFLGYTLPFRLLERLAQRSNQFISADRLMEELWGGLRAPSTIRSAISDLRIKLRSAGMTGLAEMIDGRNPGYYGLFKKTIDSVSDALPTAVRRRSDSKKGTRR